MRFLRRMAATTAIALVAALGTVIPAGVITGGAAHAATSGGTIVFIKNHNVWLARGDGSGQVKITGDGTSSRPYAEPSMSDNGRIAVMRGSELRVINQSGKLLSSVTPDTLFIDGAGTTMFVTPIGEPVISPDGTRVAYSQFRTVNYGGSIRVEGLTGLSNVGTDDLAGGLVIGVSPSWLTNSRILFTNSGPMLFHDWGSEAEPSTWFSSEHVLPVEQWSFVDLSEPMLSPDGQKLVFLADGARALIFATVTGNPRTSVPVPPTGTCTGTETEETPEPYLSDYERPSFGPSNDDVVYEQYGNIHKVENFGACDATTTFPKIIKGGTDPDWSKATYAPGKPASAKKLTNKTLPKIKGKAKAGKTVKATAGRWSTTPKTVKFRWLRNGKAVKGAKGAKKKYKIRRSDRGKKLSVRVTVKRSGYKPGKATSKAVKVK